MGIAGFIVGVAFTLFALYTEFCYKIWDLTENDSKFGDMTLKEFAMKLYCMHWCVRLFESASEEAKES